LLPPAVRREPAGLPAPPPIERCAELLAYTLFDRSANAHMMLDITTLPPFPRQQGDRDRAEQKRIESQVTPQLLDQICGLYRERLRSRPDDLLLRLDYGHVLFFRGMFPEAEAQYSLVTERYPNEESHLLLGSALAAQGKTEAAIAHYREALRDMPGHIPSLNELILSLHRVGKTKEAIQACKDLLALRPQDEDVRAAIRALEGGTVMPP
jgi:tetratricopeptide (TPR) repeat protein